MRHLRTYNESLRSKMTPKSEEDIRKSLERFVDSDEKLMFGVENNLDWVVREAIEEGADVNLELKIFGNTMSELFYNLLQYACYCGYTEIVRLLLDAGADKSTDDNLALRAAIAHGHDDIVRMLKIGHNVNEGVRDKMTPISKDKLKEKIDKIDYPFSKLKMMFLISYPISDEELKECVSKLTRGQKLIIAVNYDLVWVFKEAIEEGADINDQGGQPLLVAIMEESFNVLKEIFKLGVKINMLNTYSILERKMNPNYQHYNTNNLIKLFKILIANGLDIHYRDDIFLQTAIETKRLELTEFLLENGANPNTSNISFIIRHFDENDTEMMNLLKKYRTEQTYESLRDKMTPRSEGELDAALKKYTPKDLFDKGDWDNDSWLMRMAIDKGLDLEMDNMSPLKTIIRQNHVDIVKYLLEKGFDFNPRGDFDPFYIAACNGHNKIAKLLIEHGVRINKKALMVAHNMDHHRTYTLLWDYYNKQEGVVSESVRNKMTGKEDKYEEWSKVYPDEVVRRFEEHFGVKVVDFRRYRFSQLIALTYRGNIPYGEYKKWFEENTGYYIDTVTRTKEGDVFIGLNPKKPIKGVNEGVRDKMTPKSKEDISRVLSDKNQWKQFKIACEHGMMDLLKKLLVEDQEHDDILDLIGLGVSIARRNGQIEVVDFLLDYQQSGKSQRMEMLRESVRDKMTPKPMEDIKDELAEVPEERKRELLLNAIRKEDLETMLVLLNAGVMITTHMVNVARQGHLLSALSLLKYIGEKRKERAELAHLKRNRTEINESVRDRMTPKSIEDIRRHLDSLDPIIKLTKILNLGTSEYYTKEEIKEELAKIDKFTRFNMIVSFKLTDYYTRQELRDLIWELPNKFELLLKHKKFVDMLSIEEFGELRNYVVNTIKANYGEKNVMFGQEIHKRMNPRYVLEYGVQSSPIDRLYRYGNGIYVIVEDTSVSERLMLYMTKRNVAFTQLTSTNYKVMSHDKIDIVLDKLVDEVLNGRLSQFVTRKITNMMR